MKNKSKNLVVFFVVIMLFLLIIFSDISRRGVSRGLIISAIIIIPSLFPFMVCIMMMIKYGFTVKNKVINCITYKIFGHNFEMFFAFLLSLFGGYPVGAKMINELENQKIINSKTADIMLMYCVNAGPAFIVSVVGGQLGYKQVGVLLLVSHILSSILIALFCAPIIKKQKNKKKITSKKSVSFSKLLVESVNDASKSIISICSFIVLFSALISLFDYFIINMSIIKNITSFIEITTALQNTKNIYYISFLLGFSGISIWCQIIALSSCRKINLRLFIFGRILHGTLSVFIIKFLLFIFKIKASTFSNNSYYSFYYLYSNVTLFVSMTVMVIFFMIFFYTKNNSRKIISDVI